MTDQNAHAARAKRAFRAEGARHEKGSAMALIADEARATDDKTTRLRALRLERDAAVVPETPQPRKIAKRAAPRR